MSHCRLRLPKLHGGHRAGSTPSHRAQQCMFTSHDVVTTLHRKESCALHRAKLDLLQQGKTLGLGRKLCAADSSHSKAGLGHRPLCCHMGKQEDLCSEAQAYIIPLEPDIRQLVPSTSTMEPNKFGGGESTARPYPLLGNNSQAENHKSPHQGTKEKSCKHQGM